MKKILFVLLMLVAVPALGQSTDIIASQDTTIAFTASVNELGPRTFDLATDGTAAITFHWLGNKTALRDTIAKSATYYLRPDYPPRHLMFSSSGPDSLSLDVTTATEVIITVTP